MSESKQEKTQGRAHERAHERAQGTNYDIDTKDIIANLRVVDKYLVKGIDFFLSVSFLTNPVLWKVIIVLYMLLMPLRVILTTVLGLTGLIYMFMGNITGIVVTGVILVYTIWLGKGTLFNSKSDLKLNDLKGWSKKWMAAIYITLIITAILNIWISGIVFAISALISSFITITLTMYLAPFLCRYFFGVVLDGLEYHPDSKYHSNPVSEE